MVVVDRYRCTYCGGCVNVCPVGALTLAETWLAVGEECTDCDCCVHACPVGAEAGLAVLLLEKRQEIGSPVRCAPLPWRRGGRETRFFPKNLVSGAWMEGCVAAR